MTCTFIEGKGRFCLLQSKILKKKKNIYSPVRWFSELIYRLEQKLGFPVITRHKEVTAIAESVFLWTDVHTVKSRADYLDPHDKRKIQRIKK